MTPHSIDSAPPPALFPAGRTIAQRYTIQRHIGRGGMGDVYEAWDGELHVPVALKMLRLDAAGTDALRRLKREVLLARSIVHPSVCRVYDLGHHVEAGADAWFLSMELLSGETLGARIRRLGRIPTEDVVRIADALAAALDAAHGSGVVHRDFKSENILLADERVAVLDFGIAVAHGGADSDNTVDMDALVVAGTPAYMAPEQVRGEAVGPAADIYALGTVLFEMTTGRLPFEGRSGVEVLTRRLVEEPPSPRALAPDVPPTWDAVIRRCLSIDPRERFARAGDVADALAGRAATEWVHTGRAPALPDDRDTFVGRAEETSTLLEMLAGASRVVTVLGPGGVGKTRLALHVGRQARDRTPGGVWLCDLTDAVTREGIAAAVARALDLSLVVGDPLEQIGHAIAARGRCLILLDNAEQVADSVADTLARWLDAAREARFLVTSRERLRLHGERVFDLAPLPEEAGLTLLLDRIRLQLPAYDPADAERASLTEIVRLVEAMPLAIELAAGRLRMMSAAQLVARLDETLRALGGPGRGRHATLTTVLDGSWEHLEPWEQAALAQCAVFDGGFTIDAAEAVVDLTAWPDAPWLLDVVQGLVDKSLLRPLAADARVPEVRLGMYVTIQQYARARLRASASGAASAAETRHGLWFARFGDHAFLDSLDTHPARRAALLRDLENIVAACRRAVARGDADVAARTFGVLYAVLLYVGPLTTLIEIGRGVARVTDGHPSQPQVLVLLGKLLWHVSESAEVQDLYARALRIAREAGNRRSEADALREIGLAAYWDGRIEEALEAVTAAGAIRDAIGDGWRRGEDHRSLGVVLRRLCRPEEAMQEFEAGLAAHRASGNRRGEATVLLSMGSLSLELGRFDAARIQYEQARAIHRETENRRGFALAQGDLGNLYVVIGDLEAASPHFTEAIAILREIGDPRNAGIMIGNLGEVRMLEGRLDDARALYEESLAVHRGTNSLFNQALQHGNIGMVLLRAGDATAARPHLEQALSLCASDASGRLEGVTWRYLAEWHIARGDERRAAEALDRAEALIRRVGEPLQLGVCLCVRAQMAARGGDSIRARACLTDAIDLARRSGALAHSELGLRIAETQRVVPA